MARAVPKQTFKLLASISEQVASFGVRKGIASATAKANPALLVLEAAEAVLNAVESFYRYRTATVHRDGLSQLLPQEEQRLNAEREKLRLQVASAKAEMEQLQKIQHLLGQLVAACAEAVRGAWKGIDLMRQEDLPDFDGIDERAEHLDEAWGQLQSALTQYQRNVN